VTSCKTQSSCPLLVEDGDLVASDGATTEVVVSEDGVRPRERCDSELVTDPAGVDLKDDVSGVLVRLFHEVR